MHSCQTLEKKIKTKPPKGQEGLKRPLIWNQDAMPLRGAGSRPPRSKRFFFSLILRFKMTFPAI